MQGYDAAGDVTNDGTYTYTYDAEGRVATVDGGSVATYVYDAEGRRVRKISSVDSEDDVYDLSGHVISAFSTTGAWQRGELYAGGEHLATYMNGTTYFAHADWLGTERVRSTVSAGIDPGSEWPSYPFGEGSSAPNPSPLHFTGKERDTESGNDYFGARYYASTMGRWISPDPSGLFFADPGNPQSFNLYGYVRNNPLNSIDTDGLLTIILPGTWADESSDAWNYNMPLVGEARTHFNETHKVWIDFWDPRGDSQKDRWNAAWGLKYFIDHYNFALAGC